MKLKINEIAEVMIGHTYRGGVEDNPLGETLLVQSKDIMSNGTVDIEDLPKVALGENRSKAYLEKDDVLLSSRGVFKAGVWENEELNALATSTVYVIRLRSKKISPYFLALFLNSEAGQKEMKEFIHGATIQALPKQQFLNVEVPILSEKDQKMAIEIYKLGQEIAHLQIKKQKLSEGIAEAAIRTILTR